MLTHPKSNNHHGRYRTFIVIVGIIVAVVIGFSVSASDKSFNDFHESNQSNVEAPQIMSSLVKGSLLVKSLFLY
ncbi:MAG: hypothetical protein RJQ09_06170 [Cyclobacteriaceae bacterium]